MSRFRSSLPYSAGQAIVVLVLVTAISSCAQFPQVDAAEASRAGPDTIKPTLLPVAELLDESRFSAPRAQVAGDHLTARTAGLRQRANALRRANPAP